MSGGFNNFGGMGSGSFGGMPGGFNSFGGMGGGSFGGFDDDDPLPIPPKLLNPLPNTFPPRSPAMNFKTLNTIYSKF
jgi:hypothetical protein